MKRERERGREREREREREGEREREMGCHNSCMHLCRLPVCVCVQGESE